MPRHLLASTAFVGLLAIPVGAPAAHADEPAKRGGPTPVAVDDAELSTDDAVTGNLARGLIDRTLITGRGTLTAASGPWAVFVQPSWVYGEVNGIRTDNELYTRTIVFRSLTDRTFAFAVGVYEHSLHRNINGRVFAGGGGGVNVLRARDQQLLVSAGIVDEVTWFGTPDLDDGSVLDDRRRNAVRASLRAYGRYAFADGRVALIHDFYVMPSVTTSADLRAIAYVALDVPLHAGLAARVALDASYEQVIVMGTRHDDLAVTFGLSYSGTWKH